MLSASTNDEEDHAHTEERNPSRCRQDEDGNDTLPESDTSRRDEAGGSQELTACVDEAGGREDDGTGDDPQVDGPSHDQARCSEDDAQGDPVDDPEVDRCVDDPQVDGPACRPQDGDVEEDDGTRPRAPLEGSRLSAG